MKEFKNLQELVLKSEELVLRIEDANEAHERLIAELNKSATDTRKAVTMMDKVIKTLPEIEEKLDSIVNTINFIDAEKMQKDMNDSFAGINIEFDYEEINKSMNLRLIEFFKEMHLDTFAGHIDSHIATYNQRCKQIDTSMSKFQSITNAVKRLEVQITDYEHSLSRMQPKDNFVKSSILASLGALTGSILTYFII